MSKSILEQDFELLLKGHKIQGFSQQVLFHPYRRWRFDFANTSLKIAIELHGGVWVNGRHTTGAGFTKDREKMNEAQLLGWIVLECTEKHIKSGEALAWLERALKLRGES